LRCGFAVEEEDVGIKGQSGSDRLGRRPEFAGSKERDGKAERLRERMRTNQDAVSSAPATSSFFLHASYFRRLLQDREDVLEEVEVVMPVRLALARARTTPR